MAVYRSNQFAVGLAAVVLAAAACRGIYPPVFRCSAAVAAPNRVMRVAAYCAWSAGDRCHQLVHAFDVDDVIAIVCCPVQVEKPVFANPNQVFHPDCRSDYPVLQWTAVASPKKVPP